MPIDLVTEIQDRPYRRWIEGSGISLEANTPRTPKDGTYYVLQEGEVRFSSEKLEAAQEVFQNLTNDYWEALLSHSDTQKRLDGARGLFRHDPKHERALEILTAEGDDQDRHRIAKARQRARYEERRKQAAR